MLALFGGMGEFDGWAEDVHQELVRSAAGDGSARVIFTGHGDAADAREELDFFRRVGIRATDVWICSRSDADRVSVARELAGCSLIFMHGGMPAWLVDVLADTEAWRAILDALEDGTSFAATSGGIMCLGSQVPRFDDDLKMMEWVPGLALFPSMVIASHWDGERFRWLREPYEELPPETTVIAVEGSTVGIVDGSRWHVAGKGHVHLIHGEHDERHVPGSRFERELSR